MSLAHDKICSFTETWKVLECHDPIVKDRTSCLWHFLHTLFMSQYFQEMLPLIFLSRPSHQVPVDKCYIIYTNNDDPIYLQHPAHVLSMCSKEWCLDSDIQVRNKRTVCFQSFPNWLALSVLFLKWDERTLVFFACSYQEGKPNRFGRILRI